MVKTTTVQKIWLGKTTTYLPSKNFDYHTKIGKEQNFLLTFFINTILNFGQERFFLQIFEFKFSRLWFFLQFFEILP